MEPLLTNAELAAVARVEANMETLQQDGMRRLEIAFASKIIRTRRRHNLLKLVRKGRK